MDYLFTIFAILISVSAIGIFFLYKVRNEKVRNYIYYGLIFWSLLVGVITYTSLPENYTFQKLLSMIILLPALVSLFINKKNREVSYKLAVISLILIIVDLIMP